jgi:tetratricopeptide (TPR) repeat protein
MRLTLGTLALVLSVGAVARAEDRKAAKSHYDRAVSAYKAGDYKTAIAEYSASYELSPQPGTLYAIGKAYEDDGQAEMALRSFREYLDAAPTGSYHELAEAEVKKLEPQLHPQATTEADKEAPRDDTSIAREHFDRGTKEYDLGHYAEAVKEYEQAYRAKPHPELLFNVGQAFRGLGDADNAIRAFKSYLRRLPDAPNRSQVEERIAELQKSLELQRKSDVRPPQGTLPPGPLQIVLQAPTTRSANDAELRAARKKRIAGFAVAGAGIAGLALGGAFLGLAGSANNQIVSGTMWSESQQSRRDSFVAANIACFAIGGAAVATGLVLYLVGRHDAHKQYPLERLNLTPTVGPQGAGATLTGSF